MVGKGRKVVLDESLEDGEEFIEDSNDVREESLVSLEEEGDKRNESSLVVGKVSEKPVDNKRNELSEITIGMGWAGLSKKEEGFLNKLFKSNEGIDLDMSVFMLDKDRKLLSNRNVVYFNNLVSECGSVKHLGDTRRSDVNDGDNERIVVNLKEVPQNTESLVVVSTIHRSKQTKNHFGLAKDAFVRLYNDRTGRELLRFDLTDDFEGKYSVLVAEIKRAGDKWEFNGLGNGMGVKTLNSIKSLFV